MTLDMIQILRYFLMCVKVNRGFDRRGCKIATAFCIEQEVFVLRPVKTSKRTPYQKSFVAYLVDALKMHKIIFKHYRIRR